MLAKTEMGYANLIFTSNLRDPLNKITSSPPPLPQQYNPPPPFPPYTSKDFSKNFNPPPPPSSWRERVHAMCTICNGVLVFDQMSFGLTLGRSFDVNISFI